MIAKKTLSNINKEKDKEKDKPGYNPNPNEENNNGDYRKELEERRRREERREPDYKEFKEGSKNLTDYFRDYKYRINWDNSLEDVPLEDVAEVRLTTKDNQEYYADFVSKDFIDSIFKKNKRTGEYANGTYFCIPNMILVEKITEGNVKKTIDSLIENLKIKNYFKKIN
jgi:hypothetical protein